MENETLELVLNAIAGPSSGIVVALLSMFGFGYFLVKFLLPQQERELDKVLASHEADRKTFEKSVGAMSKRLDKIEDDLTVIKSKI